MNDTKKPEDQDIGRPGTWGTGRYEKDQQKLPTQTVLKQPKEGDSPPDETSTPVTRKDYE